MAQTESAKAASKTAKSTDQTEPRSFQSQVWDTLSVIDCGDYVKQKNGLTYLSWAWAWGILMSKYPESSYAFEQERVFADGSMEVVVEVTARKGEDTLSRRMVLPVMDHRNKAIANPDARQISDARMRCLVKAIAMLGLGHYIYAGEDIPENAENASDLYQPPAPLPGLAPPPLSSDAGGATPPVSPTAPPEGETSPTEQGANAPEPTPQDQGGPSQADVQRGVAGVIVTQEGPKDYTINNAEEAKVHVDVLMQVAKGMHSNSQASLADFYRRNLKSIDVLDKQYHDEYQRLLRGLTALKQEMINNGITE